MFPGFSLTLAQAGGSPPEDAPPVTSAPAAPSNTGTPSGAAPVDGTASVPGDTLSGVDPQNMADPNSPPPAPGPGNYMLIILMVMLAAMVFFSWRSSSKEKKQHQAMVDSLKKGDKVQTAGGILATIVDVKKDEIILKVDESSNTRIRVIRNAVRHVVDKDKAE